MIEGPRLRNEVLETSRKWSKECSALYSPYTEAGGVAFLAPCSNSKLKRGKQKASELDRVLQSATWDIAGERCWCHHCASRDSPVSFGCWGLALATFHYMPRKSSQGFPEERTVGSESLELLISSLPTTEKRHLRVKGFIPWFWRLDTDSLKETRFTLKRKACAPLILNQLCAITLQQ